MVIVGSYDDVPVAWARSRGGLCRGRDRRQGSRGLPFSDYTQAKALPPWQRKSAQQRCREATKAHLPRGARAFHPRYRECRARRGAGLKFRLAMRIDTPVLSPCPMVRSRSRNNGTWRGRTGYADRARAAYSSSSFRTAMNASGVTSTLPRRRIFFFPSFCFSRSFFFRVISPP